MTKASRSLTYSPSRLLYAYSGWTPVLRVKQVTVKNTTQNTPKLTILRAKSNFFSGEGHSALPRWGGDTPSPHPTSPLGAFGASILAPAVVDLGACGASSSPLGARRSRSFSFTTRTLSVFTHSDGFTVFVFVAGLTIGLCRRLPWTILLEKIGCYRLLCPGPIAGALSDDARLTSVCRVHRA